MKTSKKTSLAVCLTTAFLLQSCGALLEKKREPKIVSAQRVPVVGKNLEALETKSRTLADHTSFQGPQPIEAVRDARPLGVNELKALECSSSTPEKLPFRPLRLTNFQLKSVLTDVFGDVVQTATIRNALDYIPVDDVSGGYDVMQRNSTTNRANRIIDLGKAVANTLVNDATAFQSLGSRLTPGCAITPVMNWAGCGERLATELNIRLLRRADSLPRSKAVFDRVKAEGGSNALAWKAVIAHLLTSADLHTIVEESSPGRISARSAATKMSLALTGKLPDKELYTLIANNEILKSDVRRAQARRLLSTPGAKANFEHFVAQYFGVKGAPLANEGFDDLGRLEDETAYRNALGRDIGVTASEPVFSGTGRFEDMFKSNKALPAHPWIARAYGVPVSNQVIELESPVRANIFTRAGNLITAAGNRNIAHRGVFLLGRVLCSPPGAAPANAVAVAADVDTTGLANREAWNLKTAAPNCVGCHAQINPAGVAFDNFNGWGAFEAKERVRQRDGSIQEVDWDTRVNLSLRDGSRIDVDGPQALVHELAKSDLVKACFLVNWTESAFAFQNNRNCMLKKAFMRVSADENGSVKGSMEEIVASEEFLLR